MFDTYILSRMRDSQCLIDGFITTSHQFFILSMSDFPINFARTLGLLLLLLLLLLSLLLLIFSSLAGFERVLVTHQALCIHYSAKNFSKYTGNFEYYCFTHENL